MSHIVILSGSPSAFSRSDKVLKYLGELLEKERFSVQYISVKDVPPEDLIYGKFDSPAIERISYDIQGAAGVIIGSPVYKAAYSGALKTLIDVLPQDAFKNKPVFPLMTGGSPAHLLAVEFSLKPLIASLKGHCLQGLYVLDSQIDKQLEGSPFLEDEILSRTKKRLHEFISAVNNNRLVAI